MQSQPPSHPSSGHDGRRARQAARTADDVFRGGVRGGPPPRPLLRRPWQPATDRLWSRERERPEDRGE